MAWIFIPAYCCCDSMTGHATGAYGTSAATPVVATVVAKLNELRLAKGQPPMGFLNPFFYKHAAAFMDVTTGSNGGVSGRGRVSRGGRLGRVHGARDALVREAVGVGVSSRALGPSVKYLRAVCTMYNLFLYPLQLH